MEIKSINVRFLFGKRLFKAIMRVFIFLMCTTVFCLNTDRMLSQEKVTIEKDQIVTVDQVFKIIKKQTQLSFVYPRKVFKDMPKVQLIKGEIGVAMLLKQSLSSKNLSFELTENKTILIKEDENGKQGKSQQHQITGTVKDEDGQPLPNANILEKGTTNGAQTTFEGTFTLNVSSTNAILVVSYLGFFTKEIPVNGQEKITITLQEDTASLEEVMIVGFRYQNVSTIKAKKNTVQIADFLTQDNIGRLPDFAAADAARRIAGVNTVFEEDEATQVGIRGLPPIYTFATIDGLAIPSADRNTRVANFEVVPSSSVSRIEVYKSRTADLDGNAIGGVFNLKTRSAFDSNDRVFITNLSFGDYDFDEIARSSRNKADKNGISVRSDLTYANQFGKDNQFGIVLSGSYNRKDRDELKHPRASYSFANGDQTKPFPNRFRTNAYDNIINRYGGFAKLEYKPNTNFYLGVSGSYFKKKDDEIRYESRIDALTFDEASLTPTGGRFTRGRNRLANDRFIIEHKISNLIVDTYYKFNDKNKVDFKLGFANGTRNEDGPGSTYRTSATTDISGYFDVNDERLFYELDNDSFYQDLSNYSLIGIGGFTRNDDEDYKSFSFNYGYNMEDDSQGWGFKTGLKFRRLDHAFNNDNLSASYIGANPLALSQFVLNEAYTPGVLGQPMPLYDPYAINDFITSNPSLFEIPSNAKGTMYGRGIVEDPSSDFNIKETIGAFYGMVAYKAEHFKFFGGLRYESTKTNTTRQVQVNGDYDGTTSDNNNDFNNLLPSASMVIDLAEDVKLKTAYSKAIGRGDYGEIAPSEIVNNAEDQIFRGNPDLKPRLSDNYDASIEYYFDKGSSIFSLGVFHKNVKDDIQTESSFEGSTEVFTPVNIDGLTVTGVELNFIKSKFDFLPGFLSDFGLSSNYTFVVGERLLNDGRRLATINNMPRNSINAQLFYQSDKFDSRLAWNSIGEVLSSVRTGQEFNNRYQDAFSQFDFAFNYKYSPKLSFFIEARNLTNENRTFLGGPSQSLTEEVSEYGRSFWLGMTFKL